MKRFLLLFVLPPMLALGVVVAPLLLGDQTLCLRDFLNTHAALKAYGAEAIRNGELPLVDPLRGGGQPYLGNLNALPLYPSNLLFVVGATIWALNAHIVLHWLIAPWAMYWLARRWELAPAPAWAAGVMFAFSGYFVSQLNMANLVAGVALAPALCAAALGVGATAARPNRAAALFGALFALELLGGEPVVAVIATLAALGGALVHSGRSAGWPRLLVALACGALVAAPQWVEVVRILEFSYRGFWGYSDRVVGSWNPKLLLDWFLPFAFGRPDRLVYWGERLSGETAALFFTLFPGPLAFALVAAAGLPRARREAWAAVLCVAGLLFASMATNPLLSWVLRLPGASLFRYPIKFWLLLAIGASLLAGVGTQRLLERRGHRAGIATLTILGVGCGGFAVVLRAMPDVSARLFGVLAPESMLAADVAAERSRWIGLGLLLCALTLVLLALFHLVARRGEALLAAMLVVHAASQLAFLTPAIATDVAAEYQAPPEIARGLPDSAVLVHGSTRGMFSASDEELVQTVKKGVVAWERLAYKSLSPFAGQLAGFRYELDPSPEGLGQFMTQAVALGMKHFGDVRRVRVLRALGVDYLLLERELSDQAAALADPPDSVEAVGVRVYRYHLRDSLPEAALVGESLAAPHMNAALEAVFSPRFDPRAVAVVAGDMAKRWGPPGVARVLVRSADRLEIEADSEAGGLLVVRRAYLPIYRAWVDGKPAALRIANLSRLAVELPPGRHEVRIEADRRPLHHALVAACVGLIGFVLLGTGGRPGIIPPPFGRASTP